MSAPEKKVENFLNLPYLENFSNLDIEISDIIIIPNHDIDISRFLIPDSDLDSDQNRDARRLNLQIRCTARLLQPDQRVTSKRGGNTERLTMQVPKRGDNTERVTMHGKGYSAGSV